jgi:demethylmenaquinone methyltransferase/2-methoxy-6-polyprenyl-1,4-benzoquinol methylase
MNYDIISYYKDRAKEYEIVYAKPERQSDLLLATKILQDAFRGKSVFEIACGTGYWTEKISKTAKNILATDINDTVIEVAKSKSYLPPNVEFHIANIFNLTNINRLESLFGGFIWSHIKLQDLNAFVDVANNLVVDNGTVVFMDNNYVDGSSLPITENDNTGNTYQTRTLENGTTHKVLKNFPSETSIRELLIDKAFEIKFISLQYYWILTYRKAGKGKACC